MRLELPEPRDAVDLTMDDGTTIRVRVHGKEGATRLYLSHGNGFAIDGYLPFWGPLRERFELVLFDCRNHGRSLPAENHDYAHHVADLRRIHAEMTDRLGPRTTVGVFHSMSARAAMKDAVEGDFRWDALVLFDPSNVPLAGHPLYPMMETFQHKLTDWARGRRQRFADPRELADEYAESRAHRAWVTGTHALMAGAVLREDTAAGDWVLACPPAFEAKIYLEALALDLWPRPEDYGGPVKLIGADPTVEHPTPSATANRALCEENGYVYEAVAGAGHMLQIEKPEECIRAMTAFLEDCGIAT